MSLNFSVRSAGQRSSASIIFFLTAALSLATCAVNSTCLAAISKGVSFGWTWPYRSGSWPSVAWLDMVAVELVCWVLYDVVPARSSVFCLPPMPNLVSRQRSRSFSEFGICRLFVVRFAPFLPLPAPKPQPYRIAAATKQKRQSGPIEDRRHHSSLKEKRP